MEGNTTQEFAINLIKQDSRRYAKKQLSWFNRDKEIHWFHPDEKKAIFDFVKSKTQHED
jgi:tRNA dimethylallyltransferase